MSKLEKAKQGPSDTAPKESKIHPEKHKKPGNLSHTEEIVYQHQLSQVTVNDAQLLKLRQGWEASLFSSILCFTPASCIKLKSRSKSSILLQSLQKL